MEPVVTVAPVVILGDIVTDDKIQSFTGIQSILECIQMLLVCIEVYKKRLVDVPRDREVYLFSGIFTFLETLVSVEKSIYGFEVNGS